jgi:hypothetical protein
MYDVISSWAYTMRGDVDTLLIWYQHYSMMTRKIKARGLLGAHSQTSIDRL